MGVVWGTHHAQVWFRAIAAWCHRDEGADQGLHLGCRAWEVSRVDHRDPCMGHCDPGDTHGPMLLLGTSASLLVTSALLVVTRSYLHGLTCNHALSRGDPQAVARYPCIAGGTSMPSTLTSGNLSVRSPFLSFFWHEGYESRPKKHFCCLLPLIATHHRLDRLPFVRPGNLCPSGCPGASSLAGGRES